jgi:group I intron endonuclease
MFIYIIVNNLTLKFYIGQHKGDDLLQYLQEKINHAHYYPNKRSHLYAAMRKYPKSVWSIHPLVSGIETREELNECERLLIYALKSQHPDVGYNICDGGEGFTGHQSESAKAKITAALMNRPVSVETRAKIGAANAIAAKGRHPSVETRAKLSAALEGRHTSTGMLGRAHSAETLAKMRESAKRRGISAETQRKMLESRRKQTFCS